MMSFVPASFEIVGYLLFAPAILGITRVEAAVMGSVLAAVSPAVVVPRMVQLMETKYGTEKAIPQMIMAGASCDDIFVIVLFTTFLSMAQGGSADIKAFANIPVSIILGIILGAIVGYLLYLFFETAYAKKHYVRNSMKVIIVLGFSFLLIAIEGWLEGKIAVSGLLAVVSMACVLKMKCTAFVSKAGCGSDSFRSGGCCCGYPLYTGSRTCRSCYDFRCADLPVFRRTALYRKNKSFCKRKSFLRDRLSPESNRTGCNWLCSIRRRTAVW